ncbi:MAG: hypothetical protein OXC26_14005 [Albidovulum sp.]|nr:hypothetical protein [Albidovulum sp.]
MLRAISFLNHPQIFALATNERRRFARVTGSRSCGETSKIRVGDEVRINFHVGNVMGNQCCKLKNRIPDIPVASGHLITQFNPHPESRRFLVMRFASSKMTNQLMVPC